MSDTRAINAISYDLNALRSPTQIYDVTTGQLKAYDDPTRDLIDTPKGTLYTIEGVTDEDGNLRQMSIAELVMCICLARATEMEENILSIMADMSENTNILNYMSSIENELLDGKTIDTIKGEYTFNGKTYTSALDFLMAVLNMDSAEYKAKTENINSIIDRLNAGEGIYTMKGSYSYDGVNTTSAAEYLRLMGFDPEVGDLRIGDTEKLMYTDMIREMDDFTFMFDDEEKIEECVRMSKFFSDFRYITYDQDLFYAEVERCARPQLLPALQAELLNIDGNVTEDELQAMSTDDLITKMETKMDSLNSFSQQRMLELQSETNKRDQSYDLITNYLKSLNTVQVGIANNI